MNEPIAGALVKLTTESGKVLLTLPARGKALAQRVKLTSETGKALLALPARGKALVRSMPEPVQLGLEKLSSRGAQVCREIFAGVLVIGLIAIVLGYGRLARGPLSLPTLVPTIETAINDQLTDMSVKIDDAVLQRSAEGPGILFRLRNIRLIDKDGSIVAQAPLAAIGMSGSALLKGQLAPGSVDFIGPRLLLFYNDDQGLSLTFSRPPAADTEAAIRGSIGEGEGMAIPEPGDAVATRPESPIAAGGRRLDVTSAVNDVFDRARKGSTSSYLTRFGFKDALVVLNQNGSQTLWQVPDFAIDLKHRNRRSIIVGQANLASSKGDWQLELRTEQHPRRGTLSMTALIQDLVPSGIAGNFPSIGILRALDMAVDGEATLELSNSGEYLAGDAHLRLAPGQITPPWDRDKPLRIDGGQLQVRYDATGKGAIEILPSTLNWGKSKATVSGTFSPVRGADGTPVSWDFNLKADDAVLAVEEHGLAPMKIDEWTAQGNVATKEGRLSLSRFVIRSGSAQVSFAGTVAEAPDAPGSPEVKLAGEISPMPADAFKQFWPKFLAGNARAWALERIAGGEVRGGKFNIALAPGDLARIEQGQDAPEGALTMDLAASGLNITYMPKMPPVATGDSRLTVVGTELAIDIPQAKIALPSGEAIALTEGRFRIPDLRVDPQQGEITFKAAGLTPTVLELLDHEPLLYLQSVGLKTDLLGGTTDGSFALSMPLVADLEFKEIKLNGVARLEDALTPNLMGGGVPIEGGGFDVTLNDRGVEARGEIRIKDVPAELLWQRLFYTPDDQQPPASVTAELDEALREKLGFKINHLVKGKTPVNLSIAGFGRETQKLSLQADLSGARLMFGDMGWTKPAGRAATVDFDVVKHEDGSVDLANLRIMGDEIAIQGSVALGPDHRLKGFHLSDLSVNRFTHVEITATVREDEVLEIRAQGPSFDGREFFQSLFSPGQFVEASKDTGEAFAGVDFAAQIGTVAGLYNTTATDVQVTMQKRNGRLVALDGKGTLNGSAAATVRLEQSGGSRLIKVDSADAGSAFRLAGFYPNVEGGNAKLQVNLDAGAKGSISGTLWAQDFTVKGDSVVGDVLSDPSSQAVLGDRKPQRTAGTRIAFTQLRAPFTVGAGKFRLRDAYMNGPQLGATMRGTVDFKSDTVELGGTYVPLYGLNSALGAIPILGKVLVGRKGEGVVGITFAIKGKLDDPTVLVNPMSVMTPGIFRQLFEFTGSVPEGAAATTQATPESGFGMPAQP